MAVTHHPKNRSIPCNFVQSLPSWLGLLTLIITLIAPWACAWAALAPTPITVDSQVKVSFSEFEYNERTKTYDGRAKLTNRSTQPISTPIRLVITHIQPSTVSLANATGLLTDGSRYVDVPVSDGTLSPGEIVKNVLLKFNNPKRAKFTFNNSVLGVIPQANHPPVAVAVIQPGQNAFVGSTIALDGSGSYDLDGDQLSYQWRVDPAQPANAVTINNTTAIQPNVTLNQKGTYQVILVVNDGKVDSVPAYVTITTENSIPVAVAGAGQTVFVGQTATLDGGGSWDQDLDPLTYLWNLSAKPPTSAAALLNPTTQTPSLTPDKPGSYTVELTVNDGIANSLATAVSQVKIDTKNSKPIANAGADQLDKTVGVVIKLDGSASSDIDGDALSYLWSLISKPNGSIADINVADQSKKITTFTPDSIGDYVGQLIVNDGQENSAPDTALVTVTVSAPVNHPPVFTSSPNPSATVGSPYSYNVQASDADSQTLTYGLTTYPTGMAINTQTGQITWTPGASQASPPDVNVTVTVTDTIDTVSQSYTITVAPAGLITVPNLVSLSRADAETALHTAQLTVATPTFVHDPATAGNVISQIPAASVAVVLGTSVAMTVSLGPDLGLPPDPMIIAPPPESGVATNLFDTTKFLYSGSNAVQTGVAAGTIEAKRAAVISGRVLDNNSQPISGVNLSVLDHPELGQTLSRPDGQFDLVVNGGGIVNLVYQKTGLINVQRKLDVPWQDYIRANDVVMLARDPAVTLVDFSGSSTAVQVARGSVMTDADGTRQASVLIPPGTTAQIYDTAGNLQPANSLHLRFTEFTVGTNGPLAMPGELPPTSGYTYAVELKADEATVKIGGKDVVFNHPVYYYVENFLGFPVGIHVPFGYYDPDKAAWTAAPDGRVVKILSVTNNLADLDTDGNNVADNDPALGITDAERAQLASLYAVGQSLQRIPLDHFSGGDANHPVPRPPTDANGYPKLGAPTGGPSQLDNQTQCPGSIIGCERQTLGEAVDIVGTHYALHYQSDRVLGRIGYSTLNIPISGDTLPASLKRIELEVSDLGTVFKRNFPPQLNQNFEYVSSDWSNLFGYIPHGPRPVTVRIGYVYDGFYGTPPATAGPTFGLPGSATPGAIPARQEVIVWQTNRAIVGGWDAREQGNLGGWTLDVHHAYAPYGPALYKGDGSRVSAQGQAMSWLIDTVAGSLTGNNTADGIPAVQAYLPPSPGYDSFALAADSSVYIATYADHKIRRVNPNGIITTVAGTGGGCGWGTTSFDSTAPCGDGGPALQADLPSVNHIAVGPDQSIYLVDTSLGRIRRITPDGIIRTVAGTGLPQPASCGASAFVQLHCGDGGLAIQAALYAYFLGSIDIGADGSIYLAMTSGDSFIRRIGPEGIINTIAQTGLGNISDIALAKDGSVYFIQSGPNAGYFGSSTGWIKRLGTDGSVTIVAGNGTGCNNGDICDDGLPATQARLNIPGSLSLGPDGSVYFSETRYGMAWNGSNAVRRVASDGTLSTIIQPQSNLAPQSSRSDGIPALQSANIVTRVQVGPDDNVYVMDMHTDQWNLDMRTRIRRVKTPLPQFLDLAIQMPSEDGSEVYQFDASGRHLRTVNALTGAVQEQFAYDTAGHLASVTDGNGNITRIERDGAGNATAIVSPFGQRTTLTLDANNYLNSIINPAGESHHMVYDAKGLLTSFTDPNNHTSQMTYLRGLLATDTDANGGIQSLTFPSVADQNAKGIPQGAVLRGEAIKRITPEGRATFHWTARSGAGGWTRNHAYPDGTATSTVEGADASETNTLPDGTVSKLVNSSDPRFNMLAPVPSSLTVTTGGLTATASTSRSVLLTDPNDLLSLSNLTETMTMNGRTSTSSYVASTKTLTGKSPANRSSTAILDSQGRVTQAQLGNLLAINNIYDPQGRLSSMTQGANPDDRTVNFTYNPQGFLASVTDPLNRAVVYDYDAAGRVTTQTLPDGRKIQYSYDANGNLASLQPPGKLAHVFKYTSLDQTASYEPPPIPGVTNANTTYLYDKDRALTQITRPDGQAVLFSYDNAGRLSNLQLQPANTTLDSYIYDATTGKLASITDLDGSTLGFTYNGALLTQTAWTGTVTGTLDASYDNDFRVSSLTVNKADPAALAVVYSYDADSLVTKVGNLNLARDAQNGLMTGTSLGTITDSLAYNGFGETTTYNAKAGAANLLDEQYSYDKLGRITQKIEAIQGGMVSTYAYTYDTAGRLTEVRKGVVLQSSYSYDDNGNRLIGTVLGTANNGSYDDQDRLLSYGNASYAYTDNGELVSKTVHLISGDLITSYLYDVLGNLRHVDLPGGTANNAIDYVIDGQNRRVGKKVGGILQQGFLYQDGLKIIAELDGSNAIVSRFVYATHVNVPDYMIKGGITYRLITDHLGSPRVVVQVDGTTPGQVVQRMDYDEFGNVITDTNPGFQPFGFAGGLYDRDTKLVRFGARDYDANTGRWASKDPIGFGGGDQNLFGYVMNDPLNSLDQLGLYDWLDFGEDAANFTYGLGDSLTFSLSERYRQANGTNKYVNKCSVSYKLGQIASLGVGVGRLSYAGLAKAASFAASGRQAVLLRNSLKMLFSGNPFRTYKIYTYEALLLEKGSDAAVKAAAGRTDIGLNIAAAAKVRSNDGTGCGCK